MVKRALIVCGLLCCASARAAGDPVNPFTGAPLSLEHARWALEQARLDEQLQSSLLNRRKYEVERQRLDLPGSAPPGTENMGRSLDGVLPGLKTNVGQLSSGLVGAPMPAPALQLGRSQGGASPFAKPSVKRHAAKARHAPHIVGVQSEAGVWCLLVEDPPDLAPVCPGTLLAGRHLDSVSAEQYVLDGVGHALILPVGRLVSTSEPFAVPSHAAASEVASTLGMTAEGVQTDVHSALAHDSATPLQVPAEWMR